MASPMNFSLVFKDFKYTERKSVQSNIQVAFTVLFKGLKESIHSDQMHLKISLQTKTTIA